MRVLVLGRAGQVAQELAALSWPEDWTVTFLGRTECDLALPGAVAGKILDLRPDIVMNAAAYTAVDKAETERESAYALNSNAPSEMARATDMLKIPLLHISTDYVFDGAGARPYAEIDPVAPMSVYGASKEAGETQIRQYQPRHVILRTSWVFSPFGANFVRTMLRLGGEREELSIVGDQIGGPTAASDIAATLVRIAEMIAGGVGNFGTYHYAGAPSTSWHGFAQAIFDRAAAFDLRVPNKLRKITTAEYPTPARRPLNSRLNCGAIQHAWGIIQPDWRSALDRCIDRLAPIYKMQEPGTR